MSLSTLMQNGLATLLNVVKLSSYEGMNRAVTTLHEHFTLTSYEIAQAYQESYEHALQAIRLGLDKPSFFHASVLKEFAGQVQQDYWQPYLQEHSWQAPFMWQQVNQEIRDQCHQLIQYKEVLFSGEQTPLNETELATLMTMSGSLSMTSLVVEQWRSLALIQTEDPPPWLDFLCYRDLLGTAMLFFLQEQLRQEPRVEKTLAVLQRQGLWQDVQMLKDSLQQLMTRLDLSAQIKPGDELTYHNQDSLQLVTQAKAQLQQLSHQHPQYSQLVLLGGSVLSSTGAFAEAKTLLQQAQENTLDKAQQALAAFNLFQLNLREGEFEAALQALQQAIKLDAKYALHENEKYPIERILGAGGMGCVFLCRHRLQHKLVVVKCFWESSVGTTEIVFQEVFTMSQIMSDFIPTPLDYGYADPIHQQHAFFVTEYIEGAIDGETWLAQQGKLTVATGIQVGLQLAQGLQTAHHAGILHLDLKPANILLKPTTTLDELTVKIIDFGLSRSVTPLANKALTRPPQTQLTMLGKAIFGTFDYAAPEQQGMEKYGKPTEKSDVYGFGATLYRLLTYENPRKLNPKRLSTAPALFNLLCDCMEEAPEQRITVAEIIEQLKHLTQSFPATTSTTPTPEPISIPLANKEKPETPTTSSWDDDLEQLLAMVRDKYDTKSPTSFPLTSTTTLNQDNDLSEEKLTTSDSSEIYVTCPYCQHLFTITQEGGIQCPKCQWDFEIDEDGDILSSYYQEEFNKQRYGKKR